MGLESKKNEEEARDFADRAIAVVREFEDVQFPGKPSWARHGVGLHANATLLVPCAPSGATKSYPLG